MIAVLLPELVEHHWLHYFLHNQRPEMDRDSADAHRQRANYDSKRTLVSPRLRSWCLSLQDSLWTAP